MVRIGILVVLEGDDTLAPAPLQVEADQSVSDVKALLEAHWGITTANMTLLFRGQVLLDNQLLNAIGVNDDDMLQARRQAVIPSTTAPASQSASANATFLQQFLAASGMNSGQTTQPIRSLLGFPVNIANNAEAVRQYIHNNPQLLQQISQHSELVNLLSCSDAQPLFDKLYEAQQQGMQKRREEQQRIQRLHADPFNAEAQAAIAEEIRKQNVSQNMQAAMEHNPESFTRVIMLYVKCKVNNNEISAFIDSGAQSTIMSLQCANRCGIAHLIDARFSGVAKGVGTAKILGRVHFIELKMGTHYIACSITVLDSDDMEFLFGLDMLKKHQMSIDLLKNCLRIENDEVPFLAEKDLPSSSRPKQPATTVSTPSAGASLSSSEPPSSTMTSSSTPPMTSTPPQSASIAPSLSEESISFLVALGFEREVAKKALQAANGNADLAAEILFQNGTL